jgi:hypothetical protein
VGEGVVWTQVWRYSALGMQGDRLEGKMTISGGYSPPSRDGADISESNGTSHRGSSIVSLVHAHKKVQFLNAFIND